MPDEKSGLAIALERIEREASEQTGFLDLGRLGLAELPDELFRLMHLRALNLGSAIPLEGGGWRQATANIAPNEVEGIPERLRDLPALEALFLRESRLASLDNLALFRSLRVLDCSETQVRDLAPLTGLGGLQVLNFSGTAVNNLMPLGGCSSLWRLDCSWTHVSDLAPLAPLSALRWLEFSGTVVSDLVPLATLASLQWLDCSHTKVSILSPLADLVALEELSCWDTQAVFSWLRASLSTCGKSSFFLASSNAMTHLSTRPAPNAGKRRWWFRLKPRALTTSLSRSE